MKIRTSSSVLQFKKKAEEAWKLQEWDGINDPDKELLFFGLFHDRDFEVFHNFKGEKSVFWCGGDILRLMQDYERKRVMRINKAKHYCDNKEEAENLNLAGVEAEVIPSFLGDVTAYTPSYPEGKKKVWMNAHPKRETEYGVDKARELAKLFPDVEFHIYGVDKEYEGKIPVEGDNLPNIVYHGLVKEEQLDEEIKGYHCGLRCNEKDGLSEVIVKAILLGQHAISRLPYEGVWHYETLNELARHIANLDTKPDPNIRELWINKINKFPWVK